MPQRILVVDDEPDITALVAFHLARVGYRVTTTATGVEALRAVREAVPDLVILDLMLPGLPGFDVLKELRARPETAGIGVIILSARREEADRIKGLTLEADDYLTKPFSPQELILRVQAVLRRLQTGDGGRARAGVLIVGPLAIDRAGLRVAVDNEPVTLTATEFKLLLTLVERRGRLQTRAQLLQTVWAAHPDIQTRTVDMHVQRLRAKLGPAGDLIETVRGFGYRFHAPSSEPLGS